MSTVNRGHSTFRCATGEPFGQLSHCDSSRLGSYLSSSPPGGRSPWSSCLTSALSWRSALHLWLGRRAPIRRRPPYVIHLLGAALDVPLRIHLVAAGVDQFASASGLRHSLLLQLRRSPPGAAPSPLSEGASRAVDESNRRSVMAAALPLRSRPRNRRSWRCGRDPRTGLGPTLVAQAPQAEDSGTRQIEMSRRARLLRIPDPFDHRDWIFEPKMGSFRLGLDVIYLQAKRWERTIGRPDIQQSPVRFRANGQGRACSSPLPPSAPRPSATRPRSSATPT
jgi:hypothetical protein